MNENVDGVILEDKPCPLGCIPNDAFIFEGYDRVNKLPGKYSVVRCLSCGLIRTNPRPTIESMAFYYPQDYGPYGSTRVEPGLTVPKWKDRVAKLLPLHNQSLPELPRGRMLEIGCASGGFLYQMAQQGWEVQGLEISPTAAEAAQGLGFTVYNGSLEEAPEPDQPFDLIVGWMVIEHLHDPLRVLKKLWRWTKPGGWIAISVPNTASIEFSIFQDAWYALHLPAHLYHFSPYTINLMLEKAGWKIERILHQRVLNNLMVSIGYLLQDKGYLPHISKILVDFPQRGSWQYAVYPFAFAFGLFGQTGRMTIWARKMNG